MAEKGEKVQWFLRSGTVSPKPGVRWHLRVTAEFRRLRGRDADMLTLP